MGEDDVNFLACPPASESAEIACDPPQRSAEIACDPRSPRYEPAEIACDPRGGYAMRRYLAPPDYPSFRGDAYFRAMWEKQVGEVILEDKLETPKRYWREAELLEELAAERVAEHLASKWKDVWTPPVVGCKLDAAQVMVGAAAILQRSYGKTWPACASLALAKDETLTQRPTQTLRPSMRFVILYSCDHWVLLCSVSRRTLFYDGYKKMDNLAKQKILREAKKMLVGMGQPAEYIEMVAGHWQTDPWSCGWILLQIIRNICQGMLPEVGESYAPKLDHVALAEYLNIAAADIGFQAKAIVVDDSSPQGHSFTKTPKPLAAIEPVGPAAEGVGPAISPIESVCDACGQEANAEIAGDPRDRGSNEVALQDNPLQNKAAHKAAQYFAKFKWATEKQSKAIGPAERASLAAEIKRLRDFKRKLPDGDSKIPTAERMLARMTQKLQENIEREGRKTKHKRKADKVACGLVLSREDCVSRQNEGKKLGKAIARVLQRVGEFQARAQRAKCHAMTESRKAIMLCNQMLDGKAEENSKKDARDDGKESKQSRRQMCVGIEDKSNRKKKARLSKEQPSIRDFYNYMEKREMVRLRRNVLCLPPCAGYSIVKYLGYSNRLWGLTQNFQGGSRCAHVRSLATQWMQWDHAQANRRLNSTLTN